MFGEHCYRPGVSALRATVVGAGISGLSCAYELNQRGFRVRVVARDHTANTTSAVAAAFWYPYRAEPADAVARWSLASRERFLALAEDPSAGIAARTATALTRHAEPELQPWARAAEAHVVAACELPEHLRDHYGGALRFLAPVVDTTIYLPWLRRHLERAGVSFELRNVESLSDLFDEADVVVNASGLGARELCDDPHLYGVSGQVVVVDGVAPDAVWVDEESAEISYVVPRTHTCILGGSAIEGDEQREPQAERKQAIVERCRQLVPELADARWVDDRVGVRPCRHEVRVQLCSTPRGLLGHDYGHGGAGVTLSWGCAIDLADRIDAHLGLGRASKAASGIV